MGRAQVAGIGGIVFGVFALIGTFLPNVPGGTYNVAHVERFVKSGHRPAVFVGTYLAWLAIVGLLVLLARLRTAITDPDRSSIFWALCIVGAAGWVSGFSLGSVVPITMAFGGKAVVIPTEVAYVLSVGGWVLVAGGTAAIGCALLALTLWPSALPAWVRWSTFVAGVAALAALAYFPFFLFYIWAIVIGIWLLTARREVAWHPEAAEAG